MRLALALVFVVHGGQKLFAFGLAGTAAFLGQIGVPVPAAAALGLFTRPVALLLAADMLLALLAVYARGGFFVPDGIEFVLTLLAGTLTLAALGGGAVSVDGARRATR